jgi:hypothetical protein
VLSSKSVITVIVSLIGSFNNIFLCLIKASCWEDVDIFSLLLLGIRPLSLVYMCGFKLLIKALFNLSLKVFYPFKLCLKSFLNSLNVLPLFNKGEIARLLIKRAYITRIISSSVNSGVRSP